MLETIFLIWRGLPAIDISHVWIFHSKTTSPFFSYWLCEYLYVSTKIRANVLPVLDLLPTMPLDVWKCLRHFCVHDGQSVIVKLRNWPRWAQHGKRKWTGFSRKSCSWKCGHSYDRSYLCIPYNGFQKRLLIYTISSKGSGISLRSLMGENTQVACLKSVITTVLTFPAVPYQHPSGDKRLISLRLFIQEGQTFGNGFVRNVVAKIEGAERNENKKSFR